jgi:tetratricopeptide (TPR) repeat protein
MGAQRAAVAVLSGTVPPLAASFYARQESGLGLADAPRPGETIVLVPAHEDAGGDAAASGAPGGTGKTQLAVGFAHAMWNERAVDLFVWVPAVNRTAIVAGLAQAAADLDADHPGETADATAKRFLGWLSRTRRPWAMVLDDVRSAADLDGLWPRGETGQVVVTSRLPEAALREDGRTVLGVPGFSRREALGYLNSRLTSYPDQRIEALDLAEDTGGLPISMAQAAAVVAESDSTCRDYREEFAERLKNTTGAVVDGCLPSMLVSWSLAVERAHAMTPAGLAWPALAFASVLDTTGIPATVLTSPAACRYIFGRPSTATAEDQELVRAAFRNLEKFGLLSVDKTSVARTVWVHQSVQAAVRAYLPPADVEQVVLAAANALLEAWPDPASAAATPQLSQALQDCADSLRTFAGDLMWKPAAHPLLLRSGTSLLENVLADSAIGYWQSMATSCNTRLGRADAQSVLVRDRLAAAYSAAGRMSEAMPVFETVLADREVSLGPEHPDTVTARVNLAGCYVASERGEEAIPLYELSLAQSERLFGPAHRDTLAVRASLAAAYQAAGRRDDSVSLYERTLTESELTFGPATRDTVTARGSLAAAYQSVGRLPEAIDAYQRTLADRERTQGTDHPDTVATRASLADTYRAAGRLKEAVALYERVLADRERIQGADHPDTMRAREGLALAHRGSGKVKAAISHYERVLADRERVQGPDHRDTLGTRGNLAVTYQLARRLRDAIPQFERAVSDSERLLGPGDVETLTARCSLASAYRAVGRPADAVTEVRRALADAEQYLGADHPVTVTVRESLSLLAPQDQDHAPGGRIVEHGRVVEVAIPGGDREAAGQPDRGGKLSGRPEPVGHHVADRADGPVGAMSGDAHVLGGDLAHRVDPVLMAAPPDLGADSVFLDGPLAARPGHRGEVVSGVRELGDVKPTRHQVGRHRLQMRDQIVEGEQVAE